MGLLKEASKTRLIEKTLLELAIIVSIFVSLFGAFGAYMAYGIYQNYCVFNHDLASAPACNLQGLSNALGELIIGALVAITLWISFRKKFRPFHNSWKEKAVGERGLNHKKINRRFERLEDFQQNQKGSSLNC
jgi:hypothetical protein